MRNALPTVSIYIFFVVVAHAQTKPPTFPEEHHALEAATGLRLHNVIAEPATLNGKKGLRITSADRPNPPVDEQLAVIPDLQLSSGTIEAEIAGSPETAAGEFARGFVGIAFRVQRDLKTYDAFYLRPTNGRAEDQERRNHSAQYISHPSWPWSRLRAETPSRYESYVDLEPGVWIKIRIEIDGSRARLYVHGQEQPSLIINDVKSGPEANGSIALWIGPGTLAHFRALTVRPK